MTFIQFFSVPKDLISAELVGYSLVVATALEMGGWLNSALFRLFLSHRRGSWHSCVRQLLGHGLSSSGKLLNHTSSEVGKSCLSSASTVFQRGNEVASSAAGRGVRCFPHRPDACAALCARAGCPGLALLGVEKLQRAGTMAQEQPPQPPAAQPEEPWDFEAEVTARVLCDTQNAGRARPAQVTGSAELCTPVFLSAGLRASAGAAGDQLSLQCGTAQLCPAFTLAV